MLDLDMPLPFRPQCLPSALGPLPHSVSMQTWDLVLPHFQRLAPLPLLSNEHESLLELAVRGLPGASIRDKQPIWDPSSLNNQIDKLYSAYLKHQIETRALELTAIEELERRETVLRPVRALSTTQWGPFSLALSLTSEEHESAVTDEIILDAIVKHLYLRLQWQAEVLGHYDKPLLQWCYEPYLEIIGSPFVGITWTDVRALLGETFGQHCGVRAVWAAENVDFAELVADEIVEVVGVSLPTPEQAEAWAPSIKAFLHRKGAIGWGIVPVSPDGLRQATAGRLAGRFGMVLKALAEAGITVETVVQASIIMPADSLDQLKPAEAEQAIKLTVELAELLRQAYGIE
ncbi:MAG: hypothetical protein NVS2B7_26420 [Herpetosiphon sp.]